jgi:DnaA family protein
LAFNLFNDVRETTAFLVASGETPAHLLQIRNDLRSRMSWGVSFRVHGLTDQEKVEALKKAAHEKGIYLSADVLPYLITHYPRDMHSLSVILDALDRYSLQTKRAITLPLLREMMRTNEIGI